MFYEYTQDPKAYVEYEVNILLGEALKVSIETTNLDFMKGPSSRKFYFPKDRWCRILPTLADPATDCFDSPGGDTGYQTLNTNLEDYYIHLRNGYILPFQDAQKNKVKKTKDLETFATDLYVLPVTDNTPMTLSATVNAVARGYLIFDDGVSPLPNPHANFEFYMVKNADGKTFQLTFANTGDMTKPATSAAHENLGNINILWAPKSGVSAITKATITTTAGAQAPVTIAVDPKTQTLTIPVNALFWDLVKIDLA
jgi:hypothetical protein